MSAVVPPFVAARPDASPEAAAGARGAADERPADSGTRGAPTLDGEALAARRLELLLEHAGDAIAVLDATGMVRYGSPTFRRTFAVQDVATAGDARLGRPFDFLHPDDAPRVRTLFGALLRQPGGSSDVECRYLHRDGAYRHLALSATNLLHEPAVRGVVLNARDVTASRRAEAALRASEARFRSFVEQASDTLLVLDEGLAFRYASPRVLSTLGYEPAALLGTRALSLLHPDDVGPAVEAFGRALAARGTAQQAEVRVRHADGHYCTMEAVGRVLAPTDAMPAVDVAPDMTVGDAASDAAMVGASVLVQLRDITARRAAEQALRESEERFRTLSASSPVGIFEADLAGRLVYANPRLVEIAGQAGPAILGHAWHERVHPGDRPALLEGWQRALAEGVEYAHEYRLCGGDGQERWVHGRAAPLHDESGAVVGAVGTVEDVTSRKQLEAQLQQQALHDALTGLPNRVHFGRRLEEALRRQRRRATAMPGAPDASDAADALAVLFVDLDNFKHVNDSLGHHAGDQLLCEVTERLLCATRGCDMVARLGGDEFAVLLERVRDDAAALVVAERIVRALEQPVRLGTHDARVGASVGVARADAALVAAAATAAPPCDASASGHAAAGSSSARSADVAALATELLRRADAAMYRAKNAGRGRVALHTSDGERDGRTALALAAELPGAVARGELRLLFQPIVALASGHVTGAEALVRWQHPTRGLLTPDRFIALAEETGAIVALGRWVLGAACREAAGWAPSAEAPRRVAVNVSARQLEDPAFVDDVRAALAESGLDPARLVLELTESVLADHGDATIARLQALRALGVQLAIDDFGTGYSSLAYLHRFPVDVLKVDRAFVATIARGGRDAALARTVVALGEALGVRCVAEGVESAEQETALRALGCAQAQGFRYSRPVPPETLARLGAGPLPADADA